MSNSKQQLIENLANSTVNWDHRNQEMWAAGLSVLGFANFSVKLTQIYKLY